MGVWMRERDMVTLEVIRSKNPPCVQRDCAKFKRICNEVNSDLRIAKKIIATNIHLNFYNQSNRPCQMRGVNNTFPQHAQTACENQSLTIEYINISTLLKTLHSSVIG